MLKLEELSVSYGNMHILKDISFEVKEGDWLMIMGANGAGKTTITTAISQKIPYQGKIILKGKNIKEYSSKERARQIGILLQNHYLQYSYKVKDIVALGGYSREKPLKKEMKSALELTGISKMENRSVLTLSGGELQRTFLAQILVQDPAIMILDEPANHLDIVYQEMIFDLIDKWRKKEGKAVISVVHDLRLARYYGTKALLLKDGRVLKWGEIKEVMTRENLEKAYNIDIYKWMDKLNSKWI